MLTSIHSTRTHVAVHPAYRNDCTGGCRSVAALLHVRCSMGKRCSNVVDVTISPPWRAPWAHPPAGCSAASGRGAPPPDAGTPAPPPRRAQSAMGGGNHQTTAPAHVLILFSQGEVCRARLSLSNHLDMKGSMHYMGSSSHVTSTARHWAIKHARTAYQVLSGDSLS